MTDGRPRRGRGSGDESDHHERDESTGFTNVMTAAAFDHDIGGRLRAARIDAGLTLTDAAKRLGTSTSQLSKIERGQLVNPPRVSLLSKAASLYKKPLNEFMMAAGLDELPVVESEDEPTIDEQFMNLMLDDGLSPTGVKPSDLQHVAQLHKRWFLQLFRNAWNSGVEYGRHDIGPRPHEVLGCPPRDTSDPGEGSEDYEPFARLPYWNDSDEPEGDGS